MIPRTVHQLWKTNDIPRKWRNAVQSVRRLHPDWEYRLWTDEDIDGYVRAKHPEFYDVFVGFSRNIMRADVFRYILMHDIGGLYCDLDYEFLRPYDYSGAEIVLSLESDRSYGDMEDRVANYFLASTPGHPFWKDVLLDLKQDPPEVHSYNSVVAATGPLLITRVLEKSRSRYDGIRLTNKPVFSPVRIHGPLERKILMNSGITYGFHHGSGSWKERSSAEYWRLKLKRLVGI